MGTEIGALEDRPAEFAVVERRAMAVLAVMHVGRSAVFDLFGRECDRGLLTVPTRVGHRNVALLHAGQSLLTKSMDLRGIQLLRPRGGDLRWQDGREVAGELLVVAPGRQDMIENRGDLVVAELRPRRHDAVEAIALDDDHSLEPE